jgi:hypothetical protein
MQATALLAKGVSQAGADRELVVSHRSIADWDTLESAEGRRPTCSAGAFLCHCGLRP